MLHNNMYGSMDVLIYTYTCWHV